MTTNLKANSSYFNLILSTYKEVIENLYNSNEERLYKDLTPESFYQILGIENKEQYLGLSIRSSLNFFEIFFLGLIVVNIYDGVIFKYIPPVRHNRIYPQTLYVLVYSNHCFTLNSNEKASYKRLVEKK